MKFVALIIVCTVGVFAVDSLVPLTEGNRFSGFIGGVVVATIAGIVYDILDRG